MSEIANAADVTREGLYKTFGANGNPQFATILRVIGPWESGLSQNRRGVSRRRMHWSDDQDHQLRKRGDRAQKQL
jgi:hypothetical protein